MPAACMDALVIGLVVGLQIVSMMTTRPKVGQSFRGSYFPLLERIDFEGRQTKYLSKLTYGGAVLESTVW